MESEWNKLSDAERAEFAVWREQKFAAAKAKAQAEAEKAAAPKRYDEMSEDKRRAFRTKHGILTNYGARL